MKPVEKREFAVEAAAHGRTITGRAMPYGSLGRTPSGISERFLPGAFGEIGDVIMNAYHDATQPLARTDGGGLQLHDTPEALEIQATLPETRAADDVLALVRSDVMRGLSVEFRALEDKVVAESGKRIREVVRAELVGIAVVPRAAYPATDVQARAAEARERPPWIWSV